MRPDWLQSPGLDSWERLFDIKSNHRSLFRLTTNMPQMIAPSLHGDRGIWSDDSRFHSLLRDASITLTDMLPSDVRADGFAGPSAVISDFYSLRNLSGFYMNPISIPMSSNSQLCDSLDLAKGFLSDRDEKIFHALHRYMFRTIVPAPMAIRKTASSGAPYFTAALDEKKKALAVFNEYADEILPAFGAGRLTNLYDDYGLFFTTYMGVRTQPDNVRYEDGRFLPKQREVNDADYARSGGTSGRRFDADKTAYDRHGTKIDGLFACRRRSVYAYPAMYNYFLTQFFTPLRAFYLNDAEYTYKHRSPETIAEKLNAFKSVRGYDVKQFDQSIRAWLIDAFTDGFTGFLKEEVIFFLNRVLKQPFFMPHPQVINARGVEQRPSAFNPCFGDPFDLSTFTNEVGLPSGIGPNPDMGKFFMTFAYLCLFDRHFRDVLEIGIPTILKGVHTSYALLDMGDDAVLATNDVSFWETADRVAKGEFYVRLVAEDGISFLGNVLYRDAREQLRATSNVVTFIRNRFCPEHGVQHWSRRDFAGTGWFEGKKHYSTAPRFGEVIGCIDELWRRHFREGIDVRWMVALSEERHRGVPSLSDADRAVLENPDKLYYRYDIEELHPWVLDKIVGAVPFEDYFPAIEHFFV